MEIERKFLIDKDKWDTRRLAGIERKIIRQGYLSKDKERTVRVRTVKYDGQPPSMNEGWITVKGVTNSISREEFEYEVPFLEAEEMLKLCHEYIIEKDRYSAWFDGSFWDLDLFKGINEGLMIGEVELDSEDQVFRHPNWLGKEVSHDIRYYNSSLSIHPYTHWFDGAYE